MKYAKFTAIVIVLTFAITTLAEEAQTPPAGQAGAAVQGQRGQRGGQRGGRGQQPPLTPEEEKLRAIAQERLKKPLDKIDTVWIEEMTDPEVRAAISTGGKTIGIILTGGVESNGPHLASGKHNYVLQLTGESIARRLGNALVAPIVTLEPGQVGREPGGGWVSLSQETYAAVLTDMGDSLRGMGFKSILYLGDSGSNTRGMQTAANNLNEKYKGNPAKFYHIPEYYDYASVQRYIQGELQIPEQIRIGSSNGWADGIHEEYAITALMLLNDPELVRYNQRVWAGRAVINGVSLEPKERVIEHAKQFLEVRTRLTVAGIHKAMATDPPRYGQSNNQ
jgi:creatinine amidohydrolase/Fe(II)-dependent formamide hydrolase-like protein